MSDKKVEGLQTNLRDILLKTCEGEFVKIAGTDSTKFALFNSITDDMRKEPCEIKFTKKTMIEFLDAFHRQDKTRLYHQFSEICKFLGYDINSIKEDEYKNIVSGHSLVGPNGIIAESTDFQYIQRLRVFMIRSICPRAREYGDGQVHIEREDPPYSSDPHIREKLREAAEAQWEADCQLTNKYMVMTHKIRAN